MIHLGPSIQVETIEVIEQTLSLLLRSASQAASSFSFFFGSCKIIQKYTQTAQQYSRQVHELEIVMSLHSWHPMVYPQLHHVFGQNPGY